MAREKLTILEVKEPQKVGDKGAQMVKFRARGADGKELWYTTFRQSLFDSIKVGIELEVDVETETRTHNGTEYTDRRVSQLYVDGQPVAVKGAGGRPPFGFNGRKSPEEIASIEQQVAAKLVAELWIADKLEQDSKEVKALRGWLLKQLSEAPAAPVKPAPDTKKPATSPKNLKVEFNKECKRLGWDVKTEEGLARIRQWLDQHGFVMPWEQLTDEAQEKALKMIKEEKV